MNHSCIVFNLINKINFLLLRQRLCDVSDNFVIQYVRISIANAQKALCYVLTKAGLNSKCRD